MTPTAPADEAPGPGRARAIWREIHEVLRGEILEGRYRAGDRLPSEAALAQRFGVNRHTLRRALGPLAEAGLIHVRRGAGATVTGRPVAYRLSRRTRFADNLAAAGQTAGHEYLRLETLRASAVEAEMLALPGTALVHVVEAIGLADGVPVTYSVSAFPAERFPDLLDDLPDLRSVTLAFARAGLADYQRLWTRISAESAAGARARHLRCSEGAALLVSTALNTDPEGRPVEYGRSWFPADRVQLVVGPDGTTAAPGLVLGAPSRG